MPIKIECSCGKKLSVKDEFAGRRMKCPDCGQPISIPISKNEAQDEDEWDLEDEEQGKPEDEAPSRSPGVKKRGGDQRGRSAGKAGAGAQRGLVIGLAAGGGLLVVVLLVWILWPSSKPEDNAVVTNTNENAAASSSVETPVDVTTSTATPVSAVAVTSPSDDSAVDLQALQGDWHVSDYQTDPPQSATARAQFAALIVTFKGDAMSTTLPSSPQPVASSTFKLDATQNPKTIEIKRLSGAESKTELGLYSLKADELTLCTQPTGRPLAMQPDAASKRSVMILKRGRPAGAGNTTAVAHRFDHAAWQKAKVEFDRLKYFNLLAATNDQPHLYPESVSHVGIVLLPKLRPTAPYSNRLMETLKSVSHVQLRTQDLHDMALRQLVTHPGLIALGIEGATTVTPKGLGELKKCPELRSLALHGIPVTAEQLQVIAQLQPLRSLSVNEAPLTQDMVATITQLPNLTDLSLQSTGLTDDDIAPLTKHTQLKALFLDNTKLTDRGLKSLQDLRGLKLFSVRGMKVTPGAIKEFETALPQCNVLK